MSDIIMYEHHGVYVAVQEHLKGKHQEHCLCYRCSCFYPDDPKENCKWAQLNYAMCCAPL